MTKSEQTIKIKGGAESGTEEWRMKEYGSWEDHDCAESHTVGIINREMGNSIWTLTLAEVEELWKSISYQCSAGWDVWDSPEEERAIKSCWRGYKRRLEKALEDFNIQQQSIQTGTQVPSKNNNMSKIIEGYPDYLMTETDRVITKDGEIEVPVKKNKVTIKNEKGEMKTVSVGYLLTLCSPAETPKEEIPVKDNKKDEESPAKEETPKGKESKDDSKPDAKKDKKSGDKTEPKAKPDPKPKSKPKGPGVIATIYESIENSKKGKDGITFEQILTTLVKKIKGREKDSMNATIKAQIGSSKRPLRMEREKKVTFEVVEVVVNKGKKGEKTIKHFSMKSTKGATKAGK